LTSAFIGNTVNQLAQQAAPDGVGSTAEGLTPDKEWTMSKALQPYHELMQEGGLRPFPVLSDSMSPTLQRGDIAIIRPITAFVGEGIYAVGIEGPSLYRVTRKISAREFILASDNTAYPPQTVSADWFRENVVGKVVYAINVIDRSLLPDGLRF
jgi:hypothetical protein